MSKMYVVLCFLFNLLCLAKIAKATFWRIKGREQVEWAKKEKLVTEAFFHIFVSFSCYLTKKKMVKAKFLFLC